LIREREFLKSKCQRRDFDLLEKNAPEKPKHIWKDNINMSGSGSSVGIATGYRLDGPGIESP
jgi:hypothetical protein